MKYNEYIVLAVEHVTVNGTPKHIITTSAFDRSGKFARIWITDDWYEKHQFRPGQPCSVKWNKEFKRFDGVFPVSDGVQD